MAACSVVCGVSGQMSCVRSFFRKFHLMSDDLPSCSSCSCSAGDPSRRDFLYLTAGAMGAVGAGVAIVPMVDSLNPAADTLALASVEVDLSTIPVGESKTVMWRGKPVFVRHRTPEQIQSAEAVDISTLRDPQSDKDRVKRPEWLVTIGVCTHLGCVPLGQKDTDPHGDFGGWFCPCHGSHYDSSGRIRKGPAPLNLEVPSYVFLTDTTIRIG